MSTSTRWPDVVNGLLTTIRTALPAVPVFDGNPDSDDFFPLIVVVAGNVNPDDDSAGSTQSSWHDLGPFATRDDRGTINVLVLTQSGNDIAAGNGAEFARMRGVVFDTVDAISAAIRADVTLGIAPTASGSAPQIDTIATVTRAAVTDDGPFVETRLAITYQAII